MPKCAICKKEVNVGLVVDAECLKDMVKVVRCVGEIPLDRLEKICNAERDKRCVVLPDNEGDIIWARQIFKPGAEQALKEMEVQNERD